MMKMQHDDLAIMVADKHPFQRKVVLKQLHGLGYRHLFEASDNQEALKIAAQNSIDLLICDLHMPAFEGLALLQQLKQQGFAGSVIISGDVDDDLIASVQRLGDLLHLSILGYLNRPINPAQLCELLVTQQKSIPKSVNEPKVPYCFDESELLAALERGEIVPYYHPKVEFADGSCCGFEVLARWNHPEYGLISPYLFITLAERHDLIDRLTKSLLETAIADQKHYAFPAPNLSLNLSAKVHIEQDFADFLLDLCARMGKSPTEIILEVSEGIVASNLGRSLEVLHQLQHHGFRLAIDNFGTGYSSMQQLTLLPFSELKIDRTFINDCGSESSRLAIIESIISLSGKLGISSVAEGVENVETWRSLANLNCHRCQGFLVSPPIPASEVAAWHTQWQQTYATLK